MSIKDRNGLPDRTSRLDEQALGKAEALMEGRIGHSIDMLVEYMIENNVRGIHPLIMGEVERRLIIKVLERSRGNKVQAAKMLGISRNTFHRKIRMLDDFNPFSGEDGGES